MKLRPLATHESSTIRTLRRARLLLVLGLVAVGMLAADRARTDAVAQTSHMVRLSTALEGEDSNLSTSGAPDHVSFQVINPTNTRVRVAISSLLLLGTEGATRLGAREVFANNHPANAGSIIVRGHATVHIAIYFTGMPAGRARDQRFVFRLSARVDGEEQHADSVISRTARGRRN